MIAALFLAASAASFTIPPTPDHYVTDNAGALSDSTRASIENELQTYEKATGHQIIVWIGQTTGDVPLETYTGEAADHWKVGRKGHDDGAILFLFMRDHRIRIEVGYGLENKLTDADAHRIISDDITPKMRAGDPDGAVSSGVADMLTTAEPSYKLATLQQPTPEENTSDNGPPWLRPIANVFVILFVIFFVYFVVVWIVSVVRYGYLIVREGPDKARRDMARSRFFMSPGFVSGGSSGGGSFGGGGGFSSGGGGFGGGGASGGW